MKPFFITGFPRSRTAWLANLMTHGKSYCHHEAVAACDPRNVLYDLSHLLSNAHAHYQHIGDSDSSVALLFPKIQDVFPGAKYVFVERPYTDAFESHRRAFPCFKHNAVVEAFDAIAVGLERMDFNVENKIKVRYDQLDDPHILNYIWEFCCPGERFDFERSEMLQTFRINQIHDQAVERAHPGFAVVSKLLEGK